ncbi:hypothetical protein DTO282F9_9083 [Paecilomyces variotii]|nr:hypothetical protein DTO282F9_9083 [Paecilomyces variotii]
MPETVSVFPWGADRQAQYLDNTSSSSSSAAVMSIWIVIVPLVPRLGTGETPVESQFPGSSSFVRAPPVIPLPGVNREKEEPVLAKFTFKALILVYHPIYIYIYIYIKAN